MRKKWINKVAVIGMLSCFVLTACGNEKEDIKTGKNETVIEETDSNKRGNSETESQNTEMESEVSEIEMESEVAESKTPVVLAETEDMGQEYLDKIIFLGDSRTYSYKAYGVLSGGKETTQVWTPKSGTMALYEQGYVMIRYPETGTDMTVREAVKLKQPEYMVIGLGTNGMASMSEEVFKAEYKALINDIKSLSPNTKIMLNSIYPVANYYKNLDQINNQKIAERNQWIIQIAEETGVKFLNTSEVLTDENGWLNIDYDNGGGATHLNKVGNELVMNYIRTHGYQ